MKNKILSVILTILVFIGSFNTAFAAPTYTVSRSIVPEITNSFFLGSTSPALTWKGLYVNNASTTVTSALSFCLTTSTCISSWGNAGSVATSSSETSGNVAYWTSTNGTPATLGSDNGFQYNDTADRITVTNATTTSLSSSVSAFFATASGNVSVATSTPWGKLSVTNAGAGPSFVVEDQTSPDATPFVVDTSGNTGIGTSTPAGKFAIKCVGNSTGKCIYSNNSSGFDVFQVLDSGNAIFGREISQLTATPISVSYGGSYGNSVEGNAGNCKWYLYRDGNANANYCIAMTASLFSLQAGNTGGIGFYVNDGTSAMRITPGAFVGIGTTTPATYLQITGADTASRMQQSIQFTGTSGGISIYDNTATRVGYWYTTGTTMSLSRTNRSFDIDNQFFMTSTGNVGIGTTTPGTYGLLVANGVIKQAALDGTMQLQNTLSSGFAGANLYDDTGQLVGSFQTGGTAASVSFLRGHMFSGARLTNGKFFQTQGPASTVIGVWDSTGNLGVGGGTTTPWARTTVLSANASTQFPLFIVASSSAAVSTSTALKVDWNSNIGIGTGTPAKLLDIFSSGTSTARIDSNSATKGSCLVMKDSDGVGYTYVTAANGVLTASTVSCE